MKKFFEKNDLIKIFGLTLLIVVLLSWIVPSSYYFNNDFIDSGLSRIGIETFFNSAYKSIEYYIFQIIYIIVLGGFYGLLSITSGYKKLVANCAKAIKGNSLKSKIILISIAFFITAFTAISRFELPVLLFVPFIISIVLKAGHDKFTAFSVTFGALFAGLTGAIYSHFSFDFVRNYLGITSITEGIRETALICILTFALLMVFMIMHLNNKKKGKKEEKSTDLFACDELEKKTKVKVWPLLIVLGFVTIYTILGFIDWEVNFKITVFNKFFEWLNNFSIGDYTVIAYILGLGPNSLALGKLQIVNLTTVLFVATAIIAIIYRVNFDELYKSFANGVKKILKPLLFYVLATMMFVVAYNTFITPTIVHGLLGKSETLSFRPITMALIGIVSAIINVDHGFTAYLFGELFAVKFATSTVPIMIILNATYGFVQFIAPTSMLLFFGLSYLDIPYKSYLKNYWKFFVGLLVMLLIVFMAI